MDPFVTEVNRATIEEDGRTIKGVASTVGNVDRMRRVFLPGAWGTQPIRVPLLAFHDDQRPIGSSVLIPQGGVLRHESTLAKTQFADEVRELVRAGAIPATSIGWVSEDRYFGWAQLERLRPELAKEAAGLGMPQGDDITYFATAEIVENSVVPVPANPMALISAASLLRGKQRGMVEGLLEMAVGARNSSADQVQLQRAHDALVELGALCNGMGGASTWTAADSGPDENGYVMRDGKRVFDPDNDGDDDSSAETDTDHDYWKPNGQMTPLALRTTMPHDRSSSDMDEIEEAATWSVSYINDLPDSSFLYIEDGGDKDSEGKTTPRSLRHFPYKDDTGKVDLPHLRNALARIPQSNLPQSVKDSVVAKAQRIAKDNGVGSEESSLEPDAISEIEQELAKLEAQFK